MFHSEMYKAHQKAQESCELHIPPALASEQGMLQGTLRMYSACTAVLY